MALLTRFSGYFPGYSDDIRKSRGDLTFAVLKAHTKNRGGRVTLASSDPRDPPRIDFRSFEEGTDASGDDLTAVVDGVRRVRRMAQTMQSVLLAEDTPGAELTGEDALKAYVRQHSWGHHASCTCAIGPRDQSGVLTSDFRVHGTEGLRVCRRQRLSAHSRLFHRLCDLHDRRESGRRHSWETRPTRALKGVAGGPGFEPRLTESEVRCSTVELSPNGRLAKRRRFLANRAARRKWKAASATERSWRRPACLSRGLPYSHISLRATKPWSPRAPAPPCALTPARERSRSPSASWGRRGGRRAGPCSGRDRPRRPRRRGSRGYARWG